jgi:hypothetical protein
MRRGSPWRREVKHSLLLNTIEYNVTGASFASVNHYCCHNIRWNRGSVIPIAT